MKEQNSPNPKFPSEIFAPELIPEYTDEDGNKRKWKIVEDVVPSNFDISKLVPKLFLYGGDPRRINGEEMRERAVMLKCNLGLCDAKRLLAEQDKIPKEFRGFGIPFTGTLLRDSYGRLHIPCLAFGIPPCDRDLASASVSCPDCEKLLREAFVSLRDAAVRLHISLPDRDFDTPMRYSDGSSLNVSAGYHLCGIGWYWYLFCSWLDERCKDGGWGDDSCFAFSEPASNV